MSDRSLSALLADTYRAYSYSYPHKTAYRPLDPPRRLAEVWRNEDRSALFLYVHIPFCEQRCGFCNLFTQAQPQHEVVDAYLATLERQAAVHEQELPGARFARYAIGGGTPTYLDAAQLDRLFRILARLGAQEVPGSVEVSPRTATEARISILRERGVTRVSIGVQSFVRDETASMSRHQDPAVLESALRTIAAAAFPVFNIDLIYGIPGQTVSSLLSSIDRAIDAGATELYLYPLYVRPMTILGARGQEPSQERVALYRAGRDWLIARGWTQASMRMFRSPRARAVGGPPYRCQDDGMVGLGIGARSYTRRLHYSSEYAVSQARIRDLVETWIAQSDDRLRSVHHGIAIDDEDERRRYVILSLLEQGVARADYRARFGTTVDGDFPQLTEAMTLGLIEDTGAVIRLTDAGVERSDVIGPWLVSSRVSELMTDYVAR